MRTGDKNGNTIEKGTSDFKGATQTTSQPADPATSSDALGRSSPRTPAVQRAILTLAAAAVALATGATAAIHHHPGTDYRATAECADVPSRAGRLLSPTSTTLGAGPDHQDHWLGAQRR